MNGSGYRELSNLSSDKEAMLGKSFENMAV